MCRIPLSPFRSALCAVLVLLTATTASAATTTAPVVALLDAAGLRRESEAVAPVAGDVVTVLHEELDVVVGTSLSDWTRTSRLVFRIEHADALEGWSAVSVGYAPWTEETPLVSARVLARDGRVHDLDPATLTESTVGREGTDTFTDRRRLTAPLPAVQVGAVVEWVIVRRTRPGRVMPFERLMFTLGGPRTANTRIRLDAPAAAAVRVDGIGAPTPTTEKRGGRQVWTWTAGNLPRRPSPEPWSRPEDVVPHGLLAVGVGSSWRDVATAYAAIVDDALRGFDARAALERDLGLDVAALKRAPRDERIQRVLDAVGARVRYTGLELGDAAVVPRSPSVTLERRFGDCKDLATLVVGLLGALDVDADVALVSTGLIPVLEAPGVDGFDHAIVFVPAGRQKGAAPLWLDATVRGLRVGEIGTAIERRKALVATRTTAALATLPATHGTAVEERTMTLAARGDATMVERSRATGALAVERRWGFDPEGAARRRERVSAWTREAWLVSPEDPVEVEFGADLAEMTIRARSATGETSLDEATAWVKIGDLLEVLPAPLRTTPEGRTPAARRTPMLTAMTFESRQVTRVVPPAGFRPVPLPDPVRWKIGPVAFEQVARAEPDGAVVVTTVLTQDALEIPAADADAIREKVTAILGGNALAISFHSGPRSLRESGDARGAVRLARQEARAASADGRARAEARLAHELIEAGLIEAARAAAERAVAANSADTEAWRTLAAASERNLLGVVRGFGADLARARVARRTVWDLETQAERRRRSARPVDATAPATPATPATPVPDDDEGTLDDERLELAQALLYEAGGGFTADGARAREAVAVLRAIPSARRSDVAIGTLTAAAAIANGPTGDLRLVEEVIGTSGTPYDAVRAAFLVQGVDVGVREAARLGTADRDRLMGFVQFVTLASRHYAEFEKVSTARGRPTSIGARAACPATIDLQRPPSRRRPEDVVTQALFEVMRPETSVEGVRRRYAVATTSHRLLMLETERIGARKTFTIAGLPSLFACDLTASTLTLRPVLEQPGGQVLQFELRAGDRLSRGHYVVVRDGADHRLFEQALNSMSHFGDAALEALARKDTARATFLVDAAALLAEAAPPPDGAAAKKPLFPANTDVKTRAALLALDGERAGEAWRHLSARQNNDDEWRTLAERAVVALVRNGETALAVPLLEKLMAGPSKRRAMLVELAVTLQRYDLAARGLDGLPPAKARRIKTQMAWAQGRSEEAARLEDETAADPTLDDAGRASLLNEQAWRRMAENQPGALDLARRARALATTNFAIEHTLAATAAAAGRPTEALESLRRLNAQTEELNGESVFVLAQLAEEMGEQDEARRLYVRAQGLLDEKIPHDRWSTKVLVDRALARLGS